MGSRNREPREASVKPSALLTPFDVTKLGSDDDPCFGKLYDLSAPECRECGDIELCAVKLSQAQRVKTMEIESTKAFRDITETDLQSAIAYVKTLIERGTHRLVAITKSAKRFNIEKTKLKQHI